MHLWLSCLSKINKLRPEHEVCFIYFRNVCLLGMYSKNILYHPGITMFNKALILICFFQAYVTETKPAIGPGKLYLIKLYIVPMPFICPVIALMRYMYIYVIPCI